MSEKRIYEQWKSYAREVLPVAPWPGENSQQRIETRRAFYAGARAAFTEIMRGLTPGPDPQPADERMLLDLEEELGDFLKAVKDGRA
jgi:hypothetical protein